MLYKPCTFISSVCTYMRAHVCVCVCACVCACACAWSLVGAMRAQSITLPAIVVGIISNVVLGVVDYILVFRLGMGLR